MGGYAAYIPLACRRIAHPRKPLSEVSKKEPEIRLLFAAAGSA
jgi:hypothetical protein